MEERDGGRVWAGLLGGLVVSGVAGILNQVVWQRALKIFLGGSETLSAMVVVLVFLGGLGAGAALASRVVAGLRNPLRTLALVELGLALCNALVAIVLGLDVTESVYAMQRFAVGFGIPLRAMYAVFSTVLLLGPTLAMGSTLPLASEGLQRQVGAASQKLVPALFFVNTVGAAFGAWSASAWLLPSVGQRASLLVAVACNATAGLVIGGLCRLPDAAPRGETPRAGAGLALSKEEILGGLQGFLALGFEMALFRLLLLSHKPLPTTFATGLAGYLLAWSAGVALSGRVAVPLPATGVVTAGLTLVAPLLCSYELTQQTLPLGLAIAIYALPCVGFGAMYGQLVSDAAKDWGRDVGRFSAVNTLGSCLGIVFFTLLGYEVPQHLGVFALALAVAAVGIAGHGTPLTAGTGALTGLAAIGLFSWGFSLPYTEDGGKRTYWGRDGVVAIDEGSNVILDGLWHTRLTDGEDYVGTEYSWLMAFAAVVAHGEEKPRRALVIGGGVGITSGTLSGVDGLRIDVYEINHTLARVLRDYPDATLHALEIPQVDWRWQDARTGLALDPTKYDVITSAPLYLRQAGSSLLLSREYLRLVKSRLAEGGVLAVYSNEGSPAQTRLVQATLAELFRYRTTWFDGLVTVAADHPITLTEAELRARLQLPDRLFREAARLDRELAREGGLWSWYDGETYLGELADRVITDDQPLIEYPELAEERVGRR